VERTARRGGVPMSAPPPGQWAPPSWATMPGGPVELEVRRGPELLQKHELKGRKFFILGRQPGMSHILVEDDTISRQHAALVHCGAALYLFDLKSAKGVAVGGKPIKPMEARLLSEGDAITLGELAVQYVVKGLGAPPAPGSDRWQPPAWAVLPTQPVNMRLMRGEEAVQELDLSRKPAYVMGRNGQQADLVVPHDSVSRQHAALVHGAPAADGSSSVHVVDLKSTMGTFIDPYSRGDWNRLPPNTPTILPVGGRVRLGECSTLLVYPSAAPPPSAKPAAEAAEDDAPRFASML
jgi:pSer/pThr/pTyr-binding forkhead associated (FHA) protein